MTTPILGLDEISESQGSKYLTHNKSLRWLEALFTRALSMGDNTPASSNDGDVFIVGDTPAGDFATFAEHDIALRYSSTWVKFTPVEGVRLWVSDLDAQYTFDGSTWVISGGLNNVVEDTTPQLGGILDCNDFQFKESSYTQIADASLGTGTHTFDFTAGDLQQITATGDITLAVSGFISGKVCSFIFEAVDFGAYAITHPAAWQFAAGTVPTYTTSGKDICLLVQDKDNVVTLYEGPKDVKAVA